MLTTRKFLDEATLTKEIIDKFLDPQQPKWAVMDKELGYHTCDSVLRDGHDNSYTFANYRRSGERVMVNFADRPCRINTYGDSYTQGHQVSNGETWQEHLAANFGEPIRNFGVGGYGLYQAYRRMLRFEKGKTSAEYMIFNVFSDDHFRNLYRWRWIHVPIYRRYFMKTLPQMKIHMLHGNPWSYMFFNPDTGLFEEIENPYATPKSLYHLCDKDYVYETYRKEFPVQAMLATEGVVDVDVQILGRVADALKIKPDFSSPDQTARTATLLLRTCAYRSSLCVFDQALKFARDHGKKIMVFLSYSKKDLHELMSGGKRHDHLFLNYLKEKKIPCVDILKKHNEDFRRFKIPLSEYLDSLHVLAAGSAIYAHYNPLGNHFFATGVKKALIEWLEPKPPAYR